MSELKITVDVPFERAREFLVKHKNVDGEPAGAPPITIRWLNKKNTFVNIGLDKADKETVIHANHNSYGCTLEDLEEIATELRKELEQKQV